MKNYCLIEIPEEVTSEEFNLFLNLFLNSMENARRFMKINKKQRELMDRLHYSIKNAQYGNATDLFYIMGEK